MVREDYEKVATFVSNNLRPMYDAIKSLQDDRRDEVKHFCKENNIATKDFNEAYRRAFKEVGNEVDMMAMAMAGDLPNDDQ